MSKLYGMVSLWHYFAENFRTVIMKRHCHNARENFVGIMKVKLAFAWTN